MSLFSPPVLFRRFWPLRGAFESRDLQKRSRDELLPKKVHQTMSGQDLQQLHYFPAGAWGRGGVRDDSDPSSHRWTCQKGGPGDWPETSSP
eukprot:5285317-Pyramimonas_sp.AAC.1